MFMDITILQGKYAPGRLLAPQTEVMFWTPVNRDAQGNSTAELTCPQAAEVRFLKPAASPNFHLTVRSSLVEGVGDEWTIVVPSDRMGILYLPPGFSAEQSIMGAVYRLPAGRQIRILADQMAGMPGLNFTVQML